MVVVIAAKAGAAPGAQPAWAQPDSLGTFRIDSLSDGQYTLNVDGSAQGRRLSFKYESPTVSVSGGQTSEIVMDVVVQQGPLQKAGG